MSKPQFIYNQATELGMAQPCMPTCQARALIFAKFVKLTRPRRSPTLVRVKFGRVAGHHRFNLIRVN